MPSKDGWSLDAEHEKITLGKKQYRNMQEWSRPCAVCGERFSIHTRANAGAVNSSFGLKTCAEHRGQRITGTAIRVPDDYEDIKREHAEFMQTIDEQFVRIESLLARVKELEEKYELKGAIKAAVNMPPWAVPQK